MEIIAEIDSLSAARNRVEPDVYTITASGEPTLHSGLGKIIRHIKSHSSKPVNILTNGSLLHLQEVRSELMAADVVIPSLDAARPESFRRINRPTACLELSEIIAGIQQFKYEFPKALWLEILLAKGINDHENDITALKEAIELIDPDRTQLNTVDRPPVEDFALPLSYEELAGIAKRLGGKVEIIAACKKQQVTAYQAIKESEIIELLRRRPCSSQDICQALHYEEAQTVAKLQSLADAKQITLAVHRSKKYWAIKE